jgi:hypothetical protein
MRKAVAACLTMIALTGCGITPSETAVLDRVQPLAADCALALAGDDIAAARAGCLPMLATIEAGAGW